MVSHHPISRRAQRFLEHLQETRADKLAQNWFSFFLLPHEPGLYEAIALFALARIDHSHSQPSDRIDQRLNNVLSPILWMLERASLADAGHYQEIANHLGPYCCSPNVDVAAMSARYFQRCPRFGEVAIPYLLKTARLDRSFPPESALSLRALAFLALNEVVPQSPVPPELHAAWKDCTEGHFRLAERSTGSENDLIANRMLWLGVAPQSESIGVIPQ